MQGTIVFRLITPKLFTRIEVACKSTFLQLKQLIEERTQIKPKDQKLYFDQKFSKKIYYSDSTLVTKIGLKQGDAIYLQNSDAKSELSNTETAKGTCNHSENEVCINCIDKKKPKKEIKKKDSVGNPLMNNEEFRRKAGLTEKCNHPIGQKCLYCMGKVDPNEEIKGKMALIGVGGLYTDKDFNKAFKRTKTLQLNYLVSNYNGLLNSKDYKYVKTNFKND